ncbi:MAG: hypothetical protein FHK80_00490 [Azoarcus sp. PHD]|nr:MAG: hypothetical protein FHK80_00490 [Azoarcus sp. PHD]
MNTIDRIKRDAADADSRIRQLARETEQAARSKGGRPRSATTHFENVLFAADTCSELSELERGYLDAVGPRSRGNTRHGERLWFADLVRCFYALQREGVTLPRGGSLSHAACALGLGDVLVKHGRVAPECLARLLRNGEYRRSVGHALARVFDRVANAVAKGTPQQSEN